MSISDISKLAITKPLNYQIAEGVISDMTVFRRMGYNAAVGSSYETVWGASTAYSYLSAADTIDVVSDSGLDTSDGTGARTVMVKGLDSDYNVQSETITMAGATAVETVNDYIRVFTARVETVGSGGVNAGNITVADVTTSTKLAYIVADEGKSLQCVWTVPADKIAVLLRWAYAELAAKVSVVALFIRPYGKSWYILKAKYLKDMTGDSTFAIPIKLEAKTDLEIRAWATAGSGKIQATFEGYYR